MFKTRFALLGGAAFLLLSISIGQGADAPTVEDLVDKLQMKPRAPGAGVVVNPRPPPKVRGGHKLTAKERKDVAETARRDALPTADLEVYFDFNSAAIAPAALPILKTLGEALSDGRLAEGRSSSAATRTQRAKPTTIKASRSGAPQPCAIFSSPIFQSLLPSSWRRATERSSSKRRTSRSPL